MNVEKLLAWRTGLLANLPALLMLGVVMLLSACGPGGKSLENAASPGLLASPSQTQNQKNSASDWATLYRSAKTEEERRAICLQAIDQEAFHRASPVSTVDEIFGTKFASSLPSKQNDNQTGVVYFAEQPPARKTSDGLIEQNAYVGWYLVVEYDDTGTIRNYYLSNLHK
jgi:hypothetical protein